MSVPHKYGKINIYNISKMYTNIQWCNFVPHMYAGLSVCDAEGCKEH